MKVTGSRLHVVYNRALSLEGPMARDVALLHAPLHLA